MLLLNIDLYIFAVLPPIPLMSKIFATFNENSELENSMFESARAFIASALRPIYLCAFNAKWPSSLLRERSLPNPGFAAGQMS